MGRCWWALVIGFTSAIIGAIFDIRQDLNIPFWVWPAVAVLALIIAQFMAFHRVRIARDKLQEQLDTRPSIEVSIANSIRDCYLDVKNSGAVGEFKAQVKIMSGAEQALGLPQIYSAYWVAAAGHVAQIMREHVDKIRIASIETTHVLMKLRLYFYDVANSRVNWVDSSSWTPTQGNQIVRPEFVLRVTISSRPSLREGTFIRCYKLSLNGLEELPHLNLTSKPLIEKQS